ncbi:MULTISPECIES: tRNA pseudouridine(38-40) synthase TruA [Acaryochloris]|uniref:tRNA pseudouridine synthase A n=1 Tax=Acaryochloris marina (strain MBIC 11017) TaxID=329726 RepID=B0C428_ACAM1|nr:MULTISPECIES: tRNA pseudouridine(38-40) synthase TruA [Acaryochloris]ABW26288.1 tRNA pseudouridine synthase A [Acaryochloris marina MBIC11017]KAI9131116.1 tRNA pseudouridine(38-40) synthase TruA [Acaryochloris sp. CCMEE 5410]BDM81111.1 tRNA pseudouridine synthase A [Acaryochloris marina MBIC10699]
MPLPSPTSQRVALVIQYLGTHFHGWQRQPQHRSVQADIEDTLAEIVQHPVTLHGAGRTDSGVHAAAQVAHFDVESPIPAHRWASVLNARLPQDILIRGSALVPSDWHARFSATWRRYRYTLYTDPCPNLFLRPYSWHYYYQPLDVQRMQAALDPLIGRHHLAAFHRAGSSRPHSWVDVHEATCVQRPTVEAKDSSPLIQIEVQASGFLYGMMRLLVGLLVQVGRGLRSPDSFTELWQAERRDQVKYSAPAKGLCLLRVGYPDFPFSPDVWFDTFPHLMMSSVPSEYCWNPAS